MADRIRKLKDQLVEQTEMITTLRQERDSTQGVIRGFYLALVKFKPDFTRMVGNYADVEFPNLRAEAAQRDASSDLLKSSMGGFAAMVDAIGQMHKELNDVYRELDQSVDDAMAQWETVRSQEKAHAKASTFRDDIAPPTQNKRVATPEVPLVPGARVDSPVSASPPVVDTSKKAEPKSKDKTGEKRSEKLSELLKPKSAATSAKK